MGKKSRRLVAITGGSGSGKSWLADKLAKALAPHVSRISLDDFYRDRSHLSVAQRERINFDHPRAIDWQALENVLRECLQGRVARLPCYDFTTHCRRKRWKILKPKPVIIVDGLWLLRRRALRRLFVYPRIYLDSSAQVRLQRRLLRDLQARGRTAASVKKQFRDAVEPMHVRYVAPQARHADFIFGQCTRKHVRLVADLLRSLAIP